MANESMSTRGKFLQAGAELLLENSLAVLGKAITNAEIAERAGFSTQTFNHHFPGPGGKATFLSELLPSLPTRHSYATEQLSAEVARQLVANSGDIRPTIRAACKWDFDQLCAANRNTRYLYLTLALGQDDPGLMRKIRDEYQEVTDSLTRVYEMVLARWGSTLRAPFSPNTLCVTLTAIAEGLSQRRQVEPSAVPDRLFGDIVIALLASIVDTEQTHGHIDDMIASIANDLAVLYRSAAEDSLPRDIRPAIIEAARVEFGRRGYFSAELAHIAATAEVSLATLKRLFPTKAHIVVCALKDKTDTLFESVTDDVKMDLSEKDIIERHLSRLAAMTLENIEYMDALLMIVAHDTWSTPESVIAAKRQLDLPKILAPVIETGQSRGTIDTSEEAYEIAAILTNTLLLRCFTRRQQAPDDIVRAVSSMCLDGILVQTISSDQLNQHNT